MKTTAFYLLLLLSWTATPALAQLKGPAQHVVLICIDGFRPNFYLEERWPAPNLQALAKSGIQAKGVRPVVPSVTFPDHITMITGALPVRHGIYHNQPFDSRGWNFGQYSDASQIKATTLWEAVKKAGGTVATLRWPVSNNAPADFVVASTRGGFAMKPEGLQAELEKQVIGQMASYLPEQPGGDFDDYRADLRLADVGAYLLRKYKPNLMTIHFLATDHFQHEQGREGEKVRKAIAVADVCVGQLIEATKAAGIFEQTTFIIVGDHGFEDRHTQLAWNSLLIKEGLLEAKPDRGNWKACFKDMFLMLKDRNDQATLNKVRQLLENQPPAIRGLYRIVERAELDRLGVDPEAVLAVQPVNGVVCTSRYDFPELVQSTPGGSHGLIPEREDLFAGFIAAGPGLRKGLTMPTLRMEDVAPHVAFLLGVPFTAPDGLLYPGIIAENLIKGY